MCAYTDRVIKGLEPENIAAINKWRRAFTKPLTDSEADDVLRLCNQIDALWDAHTQLRAEIKDKTTDPLSVVGAGAGRGASANHHPGQGPHL